ncbi:MAG: efflux RND transporter periplasmic adaptor subunit [Gammaproteobacteria bacterium]
MSNVTHAVRVTVLLGLVVLTTACGKRDAPSAPPPPEVGVVMPQPQNVPLISNFVGRLSAYRTANVSARVEGVLLKRTYKEGTEVKAGQLLFQIDPAPFKAALDSALGQLAEAQAAYANAKVQAQQSIALAPKGYVSQTDLDTALATERTDAAAVQVAEANVETARINLGYANVTSPIAGRAGEQQVTEGALVGNGSATLLTTVDQINPLYVNFTVSVGQLDELQRAAHVGDVTLANHNEISARVSLPDGSVYPEPGTLDFTSVNVNAATGAVNMRALLPNSKFRLLPGSYVTLQLAMGERHRVFLVPQAAVQRDIEGTFVLVVGKDGKVARHNVVTNGTHGVDWVITSGLAAGEQVIVSGIQQVIPGGSAKAEPWQPTAAAQSTGAPAAASDSM